MSESDSLNKSRLAADPSDGTGSPNWSLCLGTGYVVRGDEAARGELSRWQGWARGVDPLEEVGECVASRWTGMRIGVETFD